MTTEMSPWDKFIALEGRRKQSYKVWSSSWCTVGPFRVKKFGPEGQLYSGYQFCWDGESTRVFTPQTTGTVYDGTLKEILPLTLLFDCDDRRRSFRWGPSDKLITDEPIDNSGVYPCTHHHWKYVEEKDPVDPRHEGLLIYFRIDLRDTTYAFYQAKCHDAREPLRRVEHDFQIIRSGGDYPELLDELPDTIKGLTECYGLPVIHKINFYRKAQEILEQSRLEEFVRACERYPAVPIEKRS